MDLTEIKAEVDPEIVQEGLLTDEIDVGDLIVKTERCEDEDDERNNEDKKTDQPDDESDEEFNIFFSGPGASLFSPEQLRAMAKYSASIVKDLQTKVKKLKVGFSCRVCGIIKSYRDGLRGHLSTHRDGNPFRCPISTCSKLFPSRAQLNSHVNLHFPATKLYSCKHPRCKSSFRTGPKLKDHQLIHSKVRKFICQIAGCKKRFTTPGNLASHLKTHENPELREKLVCADCGMKFLSKVGYYHHTRRHKGIHKERKFTCYFCGGKRDTPSSLEMHLRSHTLEKPFRCGQCKIWLVSKIGLKSHSRVHEKTVPYSCPKCPKEFKWKQDLDLHLKIKHDENSEVFQCHGCSYRTMRSRDMARHKKNVHQNLRPYSCHLCPKTFAEKGGYVIHIKVHEGQLEFKCQMCDKAFVTQTRLMYHERTHSQEKKFACPQCGKMYKTTQGKEIHLKLTHGIGEDKKCTGNRFCYFCNKLYKGYSGYLKHTRMHTRERPYQCQEPDCSRTWLTSQENMTYHLLTKHGKGKRPVPRSDTDERFQCPKCPRNYRYKGDLMTHDRASHDETTPFQSCPQPGCGYQTRNKACMRQHKKVHMNTSFKCKNCGKSYRKKSDHYKHSKMCD